MPNDKQYDWLQTLGVPAALFSSSSSDEAAGSNSADAAAGESAPVKPALVKADFKSQTGGTDCKKTCDAMAATADTQSGASSVGIGIAVSEDKSGRIAVDPDAMREGVNYIDSQLDSNKPVVVGVSHTNHTAVGEDEMNSDKITDHFVLITGRDVDADGRVYYTFKDPATDKKHGDDDNPYNRFYMDETGCLVKAGAGGGTKDSFGRPTDITQRDYQVALVVGNTALSGKCVGNIPPQESMPEEPADWEKVREKLKQSGKSPAASGDWCKQDRDALVAYQQDKGLLDKNKKPTQDSVTPGFMARGDRTERSLLGGFDRPPDEEPMTLATDAGATSSSGGGLLDKIEGAAKSAIGTLKQKARNLEEDAAGAVKYVKNKIAGDDAPPPAASPPPPPKPQPPKTIALSGSVGSGPKTKNAPGDVKALGDALVYLGFLTANSGQCDAAFIAAISKFQKNMKTVQADGRVDPGGRTEKAINTDLQAKQG